MDLSQPFIRWVAEARPSTGTAPPGRPLEPLAAAEGTQRWLWQHRFGEMLIEVVGDEVFVNGTLVPAYRPD